MAAAQVAEAQAALDKLLAGSYGRRNGRSRSRTLRRRSPRRAGRRSDAGGRGRHRTGQDPGRNRSRQYAELASHPTPAELEAALAEETIAEAAVTQAQAAYNLVRGDPNIVGPAAGDGPAGSDGGAGGRQSEITHDQGGRHGRAIGRGAKPDRRGAGRRSRRRKAAPPAWRRRCSPLWRTRQRPGRVWIGCWPAPHEKRSPWPRHESLLPWPRWPAHRPPWTKAKSGRPWMGRSAR